MSFSSPIREPKSSVPNSNSGLLLLASVCLEEQWSNLRQTELIPQSDSGYSEEPSTLATSMSPSELANDQPMDLPLGENKSAKCGEEYKVRCLLSKHKATHTLPFECQVCGKRFSRAVRRDNHHRTHTGEKPYACSVCELRYASQSALLQHKASHTLPFECQVCGKRFSRAGHRDNHHRTHTGLKPYPCSICELRYASQSALLQHKATHTLPFECQVCGKRFSQAVHRDNHHRTHTGVKPYPCSICGLRYASQSALCKHKATHTLPFECQVCGKRFSRPVYRDNHHRTHTGEKPYACSICELRFVSQSALGFTSIYPSQHKATHTLPFECQVCGKRFSRAVRRDNHHRTHTGEKPYACSTCGLRFTKRSHVILHQRVHQ